MENKLKTAMVWHKYGAKILSPVSLHIDERTHVSNQVLGGNENKQGRFDEVTAVSLVLLFGIICAIK